MAHGVALILVRIILHRQTTDRGLLHCAVCLFSLQLLLVVIVLTCGVAAKLS